MAQSTEVFDVVAIGGCVIDLTSYSERVPKPGETLIGTKFAKAFGGKAANQCVMASRLGASTAMIGKVGDDEFGHQYKENFKQNKVNVEYVGITKDAATSVAQITVVKDGQNSIVYFPRANEYLTVEDIRSAENDLIKKVKLMILTYESISEVIHEALKIAKQHGVKTVVNAAPVNPEVSEEIYSLCDVLCVNETEAEAATGQYVESIEQAKSLTQMMLKKGCFSVILTLGSRGAVFASKEQPQAIHVPAKQVTAVDTTGAGDAFLGALAYFMTHHSSLTMKEWIKRSCEVAAMSVQNLGTQTSFPWKEDIPAELFS
ncbi:ribokinase-like isoform X2 [Tachypleus tridentatus]